MSVHLYKDCEMGTSYDGRMVDLLFSKLAAKDPHLNVGGSVLCTVWRKSTGQAIQYTSMVDHGNTDSYQWSDKQIVASKVPYDDLTWTAPKKAL